MDAPPSGLVQLSTLPPADWMGRKVWHPMSQHERPHWRPADYPQAFRWDGDFTPEEEATYEYDVGVVSFVDLQWKPVMGWDPREEVWFRTEHNTTLHYAATNLWTQL